MFERVHNWWSFATGSVGKLTTRPVDLAVVDEEVGRMLRGSELASATARIAAVVDRAWRHARVGRLVRRLGAGWVAMTGRERTQHVGWTAAVAGATALVAQSLKPTPVGSLSWVVPVLILVCGLLVVAAGVTVARRISNES